MKNNRLSGHSLMSEGRALNDEGHIQSRPEGIGRAGCSCGVKSAVLDSDRGRQRWHKTHKDEVRTEIAGNKPTGLLADAHQAAAAAVAKVQNVPFPGPRQTKLAAAAIEAYLQGLMVPGGEALGQLPVGSVVMIIKPNYNPNYPELYMRSETREPAWMEMDPSDRDDGEHKVYSAALFQGARGGIVQAIRIPVS